MRRREPLLMGTRDFNIVRNSLKQYEALEAANQADSLQYAVDHALMARHYEAEAERCRALAAEHWSAADEADDKAKYGETNGADR